MLGLAACAERTLKIKVEKVLEQWLRLHSFSDVAYYSGFDSEVTWKLYKALGATARGTASSVSALRWMLLQHCATWNWLVPTSMLKNFNCIKGTP